MAFRASNVIPSEGYDQAKIVAISAKRLADTFGAMFLATTKRDQVIRCWREMSLHSVNLTTLAAIPGIGDYAKAQEEDPTYDVAAEFTAMIVAIDAVVAEIEAVFPVDASGFLAVQKFGVGGALETGTFTPAALANIRTLLATVSASVS